MAKQQVMLMPSAELEPRDGDIDLTPDRLARLSLFTQLKGKTDLEKYPGTLRVRHYQSGDAICRQGEAGWTAFYILTAADVQNVLQARADDGHSGARYRRTIGDLLLLPEDAEPDVCATIYLSVPRPADTGRGGWLGRLGRRLFRGSTPGGAAARPRFIPLDAPTDVDRETPQAFPRAADLFGEMSCLNRSPRSRPVVA